MRVRALKNPDTHKERHMPLVARWRAKKQPLTAGWLLPEASSRPSHRFLCISSTALRHMTAQELHEAMGRPHLLAEVADYQGGSDA